MKTGASPQFLTIISGKWCPLNSNKFSRKDHDVLKHVENIQTNPIIPSGWSLLDPPWTLRDRGVQVHHAFALDLDAQLSSPPLAAALRCPAAEALVGRSLDTTKNGHGMLWISNDCGYIKSD